MFIQTDKKTCNICIIRDCVEKGSLLTIRYDNNRLRLDLVEGTKVIRFILIEMWQEGFTGFGFVSYWFLNNKQVDKQGAVRKVKSFASKRIMISARGN